MGTLMLAISAFAPAALTAGLYYLVHSTFAAAALFLVADLVMAQRGGNDTLTTTLPAGAQNGLMAALFFAAAVAMAGMPPLSGFLGKLLVMDALRAPGVIGWAWAAILAGSLVTIVGFARAGSVLFWKSTAKAPAPDPEESGTAAAGPMQVAPVLVTVGILGALAVFAGPLAGYLEATSGQIFDRAGYVGAVLGASGGS
jgi:multicomponent K+:H+ antiporter subunit D